MFLYGRKRCPMTLAVNRDLDTFKVHQSGIFGHAHTPDSLIALSRPPNGRLHVVF